MRNRHYLNEEIDAATWMCNLLDICDCGSNVLAVLQMGVSDIPVRASERGIRGAITASKRLTGWLELHGDELSKLHRVGASAIVRGEEGRDNGSEPHC